MPVPTLRWEGGRPGFVRMIEQTRLPNDCELLDVRTVDQMVDAIRRLAVRGAPAIGIAAAFGVLLAVQELRDTERDNVLGVAREAAATLAKARPTAVNLFWALDRMVERASRDHASGKSGPAIVEGLFDEANRMWQEDREACRKIGEHGAALFEDGDTVLTHCNAGGLATADCGTALAPIYVAKERGKKIAVYAGETRPLLQGARLTAWELLQSGIDVTLITDSMAARVMFEGKIDAVLVGADRIARNGDVCNKIGTYGVALLANAHKIPFYVCAPLSSFDAKLAHGGLIPIEERAAEEITHSFGTRTAPEGVQVYNPAFDLTPAHLVTAIVTEAGVIERPDTAAVEAALRRAGRL
jgi:methylthioribose-1-phosphate isomerase